MKQAIKRAPKVEIDDLQPDGTCRSFHASWQEGTLTAHAWLEPIKDQPANGYVLEYTYNHVQLNRRLTEKQIDTGRLLISKIREFMTGQMLLKGWSIVGQDERRRPIWQHASRLKTSSASKQEQPARAPKEDSLAKARRELDRTIAAHKAEQAKQETARLEQATFEIDDLAKAPYTLEMQARHESPRWYHARASAGDVQAHITIRYYGEPAYPGGYILDERIDRANRDAPGTMGKKQEQRARVLLDELRSRVHAALIRAGWQKCTTTRGVALWFYDGKQENVTSDQATSKSARRVVAVPAREKVAAYTRTVQEQEITFTCKRCGLQVEKQQYPGRMPRYCERCAKEVEREKTRARVARLRAGKKLATSKTTGKR